MFGSRFGVAPSNPIKAEYRNPPDSAQPTRAQRERTEAYYLEQLQNNKQAVKALQLQEVETAKRRVDKEFDTGFTEYLLGRMGNEDPNRLPDDKSPYTRTPGWGERNRSLMGNDEVRQYIMSRQTARDEFERYLTVLRQFRTAIGYDPQTGAYWPPGVFEHYLYFKYILRAPSDDIYSSHEFLDDFQKWKTGNTARASEGIHRLLPGTNVTKNVMLGPTPTPTSIDQNNLVEPGTRIAKDPAGVQAATINQPPPPPPPPAGQPPPPTTQPPPLPPPNMPQPPPAKSQKGQGVATVAPPAPSAVQHVKDISKQSKAVRGLVLRMTNNFKNPNSDEIMRIVNQQKAWGHTDLSQVIDLLYEPGTKKRMVSDNEFDALVTSLSDYATKGTVVNYLKIPQADRSILSSFPGFDLSKVAIGDPTRAYIDFYRGYKGDGAVMEIVRAAYDNPDNRALEQLNQLTTIADPITRRPDTEVAKKLAPFLQFDKSATDDAFFMSNQIIIDAAEQMITEGVPAGITVMHDILEKSVSFPDKDPVGQAITDACMAILADPSIPGIHKKDMLIPVLKDAPTAKLANIVAQFPSTYHNAQGNKMFFVRQYYKRQLQGP